MEIGLIGPICSSVTELVSSLLSSCFQIPSNTVSFQRKLKTEKDLMTCCTGVEYTMLLRYDY